MFRKILIANRGEIAVRILRACRELGIQTVAVFSEADRTALHVRLADEAYPIGPAPSRESYLRIDKLMDVARRAGCDALHPGYGFLAENPDLPRACAGKGMRRIAAATEMPGSWRDAVSEALNAFGDGRVYLEKYLERPRHIEIQIFGDTFGKIVHLGERECSIQRRHQKVLEESPSSFLTPELRRSMGEAAVKLGREAGYTNAGTVEFLVDAE